MKLKDAYSVEEIFVLLRSNNTVSTVSLSIFHEVMGPDAVILVFWMLSFKPTISLSSFTFIKRLFSSSSLSAKQQTNKQISI